MDEFIYVSHVFINGYVATLRHLKKRTKRSFYILMFFLTFSLSSLSRHCPEVLKVNT